LKAKTFKLQKLAQRMEKQINTLTNQLKKYKNVIAIIQFGSSLTKNFKPLSDIDIAVIAKNPSKKLESEINSNSSNIFDVVNFNRLPLYIQFNVLKTGKTIFVRNKKEFSNIQSHILREYLRMSYFYERLSKRILV